MKLIPIPFAVATAILLLGSLAEADGARTPSAEGTRGVEGVALHCSCLPQSFVDFFKNMIMSGARHSANRNITRPHLHLRVVFINRNANDVALFHR